ncbi:hypothetical protein [Pseudomonas sp. 5P_3.1_Bac2]|uniref:hypothetical protein n=1 Tax=Pseudomonas sp. 5P_3.1_Bac2 TaxID=2971617 RepID=UPI0021C8BF40|nr:hypothetical protein [Pseudomonas sp. 5P_3.1_Bac2]MCU1719641.1 hypothetical protein [Pseudomonas sp. 5P_3.1_Bac2]
MRIDGFASSYIPERGARSQAAVAPFREVQREVEARPEQPNQSTSGQDRGSLAPAVQSTASSASAAGYFARSPEQLYQAPLSNQVAQALASYSSTASFVTEGDANQVMGLDLYV